jgi:hypothetical protein
LTTNFFSPLSFVPVLGSGIRDPGSGMEKIRIRDTHPGPTTLLFVISVYLVQDDPVMDPTMQTCSLCGVSVSDLASHIVDDHTELQDMERYVITRSEFRGLFFGSAITIGVLAWG